MQLQNLDIAAMSVDAFAKRFGIGRTTAWGLIRRGELPAIKVTRRTLIRLEDANTWLASRPQREAQNG
jgi:excisionase family DNA binding protein